MLKTKSQSVMFVITVLMEMSKILNTGLDMETLATCVRLLESGVNPEALALVFNELKKESAAIQVSSFSFMNVFALF